MRTVLRAGCVPHWSLIASLRVMRDVVTREMLYSHKLNAYFIQLNDELFTCRSKHCSNAKCNYNITMLKKDCLLRLSIQSALKRKKGVTLQTLIDLEFSKWETINGNCNECKGTVLKKKP